jgi:D-amino-acid oxidase
MASAQGQRKGLVILGAGVSGLTTALLLARKNEYNISVMAKHMPGDYDIEYVRDRPVQ